MVSNRPITEPIEALDEREAGYRRVLIDSGQVESLCPWKKLPAGCRVHMYVPEGPNGVPGVSWSPVVTVRTASCIIPS